MSLCGSTKPKHSNFTANCNYFSRWLVTITLSSTFCNNIFTLAIWDWNPFFLRRYPHSIFTIHGCNCWSIWEFESFCTSDSTFPENTNYSSVCLIRNFNYLITHWSWTLTYLELQDRLEFIGIGGWFRQGLLSNWHCGPEKFSAQLHWLGDRQIPLFWQAGIQIAKTNEIWNLIRIGI